MTTEIVLTYLSDESTYQTDWRDVRVKTAFQTHPEEYLSYAQQDLMNAHPYGTINALANINRALNCQIDRLLKLFGYYRNDHILQLNLARKVRLIQAYGIEFPQRLDEVSLKRNMMEHLYERPSRKRVQGFISDIDQFIHDTSFYTTSFPPVVEYHNHLKQEEYGFYSLTIAVNCGNQCISIKTSNERLAVKGDNPLYIEVFKWHMQRSKQHWQTIRGYN